MKKQALLLTLLSLLIIPTLISGCASQKKYTQGMTPEEEFRHQEQVSELNTEVERLKQQLSELSKSESDLAKTKNELEERLRAEVDRGDIQVDLGGRGITISVLGEVLFDSGKTAIRTEARDALAKIASVLTTQAPNQLVFVEGHTDNEPINHALYKSNWELSTARSTEVIHFFVDDQAIEPMRFSAVGYGEFHPRDSNETKEGKRQNRRVEIVITPEQFARADKTSVPENDTEIDIK
jgi:chemotaxis protein MotB